MYKKKNKKNINVLCLLFELFPVIKFSCLRNISKTVKGILLKLHKVIKDIKRKCIVQEP